MNKKNLSIEFLTLILPLVLAWINSKYSTISRFSWGNNNINLITNIAIIIGILGNIWLYTKNNEAIIPSKGWKILSILIIFILTTLLYAGNSISNFGF